MAEGYGKLTEDQFRQVIRKLPGFRKDSLFLQDAIREVNPDKLREILGDDFRWAPFYERSLAQLVATIVYFIVQAERLKAIVKLPDPEEVVLKKWGGLAETAEPEIVPEQPGSSFSLSHSRPFNFANNLKAIGRPVESLHAVRRQQLRPLGYAVPRGNGWDAE